MTNDTIRPAFPDARVKNRKVKKSVWLLAILGLIVLGFGAGFVGATIGYIDGRAGRSFADSRMPWILMAFALVSMVPTLWWCAKYWKSIDEMARRAHLDAFFWGGGVISWAVFLPFITPMVAFSEFKLNLIESLKISSTHAFGLGAAVAIATTLLGYGLFWLFWWAKKR
jgi:hypothetical protein